MEINSAVIREFLIALLIRAKELLTDKAEFKANAKSLSTGVGVTGIGTLAIFSPGVHGSIGGFDTLEKQVVHLAIGIVEAAFAIYSAYMTVKKPTQKNI